MSADEIEYMDVYDEKAILRIVESVYPEGLYLPSVDDEYDSTSLYLDQESLVDLANEILDYFNE